MNEDVFLKSHDQFSGLSTSFVIHGQIDYRFDYMPDLGFMTLRNLYCIESTIN